jgi:stage II sporulation protein D
MGVGFVAMLLWSVCASALTASDGGGRDVSVVLFSTHPVRSLTVTPLGAEAWTATCAACAHEPLRVALKVQGGMEVFAGGTLRVTDDASGDTRTAVGLWHLRGSAARQDVDVVLTLPSERYVTAVVGAESGKGEPAESLRVMAILARTYALNGSHFRAPPGHLTAELCDSTQCEVMSSVPVSTAVVEAVRATAGETLWFEGRRAEVYFSQSCGGLTEEAGEVWPSLRGASYLQSHADPYCLRRGSDAWHAEVPLSTFAEIAKREGWRLPATIVSAGIDQRSVSHRALRVYFAGDDGKKVYVAGSSLRFGVGRALGWNQVRSDWYELGVRNGSLVFDGRGHGHGVGLCQVGAKQMAVEGKSAREILAFYFPGTAVRVQPTDEGWQQMQIGPLVVRTTEPISDERKTQLQAEWAEAQRRFPVQRAPSPQIVITPTTEVFRQLTGQPGWALASTSGSSIVLQPDAVLRAHGRAAAGTLQHEMLHVLVESEASDQASLWLREGLVEELAGEARGGASAMTVAAMEAALRHSSTLEASEQAHAAAGARVHALIARYGLPVVRGWLASGAPAGVA